MKDDPGRGHDGSLEYHQRMLADPHRVDAYDRALRRLVRPGARVLDAGAGTGILAMLAARAGAGRVTAVESMPIAELARTLVAHNGLHDRVTVVREDLRTLRPLHEVDVIVSDCLGRFLVDDHMLDAMQAAFAWLAPGGVVIPAEVTLVVAPVVVQHFPAVDGFSRPLLGVDLGPAEHLAEHAAWGGAFSSAALLAPPQDFATWVLPGRAPRFDRELAFTFTRAGRLRGLAGWFRATLAPGVTLETAPEIETHWQQMFLPLPATGVGLGDRLEVRLFLEDGAPGPLWARTGHVITRDGARPFERRAGADTAPSMPRWRTTQGAAGTSAAELDGLGAGAWTNGDLATAARLFEDAAMALRPGEDAAGVWEDLGIARHAMGDWTGAIQPLLRALDGDLTSREQSLRLLVDACMRGQRQIDGARYLARYEATFGPHPAGWAMR